MSKEVVTKAGKQISNAWFMCFIFFNILAALVYSEKFPVEIIGFFVLISVITFAVYAKDKAAAQAGRWRTSEFNLHMLSLVGGWPGAALAQSYLRHKSSKQSFRFTYWVTVILNCAGVAWLLTPDGSYKLNKILSNLGVI